MRKISLFVVAMFIALTSTLAVASVNTKNDDCCKPGAACCKPGAACCADHEKAAAPGTKQDVAKTTTATVRTEKSAVDCCKASAACCKPGAECCADHNSMNHTTKKAAVTKKAAATKTATKATSALALPAGKAMASNGSGTGCCTPEAVCCVPGAACCNQ